MRITAFTPVVKSEAIESVAGVVLTIPMKKMKSIIKGGEGSKGILRSKISFYRNAFGLRGEEIYIEREFFGFSDKDLGRSKVCNVCVIKNTLSDGREYIMLKVFKAKKYVDKKYKMIITDNNAEEGVDIIHTKKKICFKEITSKTNPDILLG